MKETKRTIKVSEHIRLDTSPGSAKWQARVKLADGSWHRFSTKTESIERATEVAMKFFYTSEDRLKNNLPQSTRKFRRVAEFARDRMQEELDCDKRTCRVQHTTVALLQHTDLHIYIHTA